MNPDIKKRWIEALPQYKQGTEVLRFNDEFCCLGVLCDLHAKETGRTWEYDQVKKEFSYLGERLYLPLEVVKWAGLDSHSPKSGEKYLAKRNDEGESFSSIAVVINEHL